MWTWFEADTAVVARQEAFDECQRAGGPACAGLNVICLTDSERRDSGAAAAAQLLPEIQADRYLRQAVRYLQLRGREAEHYTAALDLMNRAESGKVAAAAGDARPDVWDQRRADLRRKAARGRVLDGVGQPAGMLRLESQPPDGRDRGMAWGVFRDMAQGTGTLTRVWGDGKNTLESTGRFRDGKKHGDWVFRFADGDVLEGPYVWCEYSALTLTPISLMERRVDE